MCFQVQESHLRTTYQRNWERSRFKAEVQLHTRLKATIILTLKNGIHNELLCWLEPHWCSRKPVWSCVDPQRIKLCQSQVNLLTTVPLLNRPHTLHLVRSVKYLAKVWNTDNDNPDFTKPSLQQPEESQCSKPGSQTFIQLEISVLKRGKKILLCFSSAALDSSTAWVLAGIN